ncbi:hypothetical protein HZH66_012488 [Vespula vulgaris]|uniref:Uncharacterized protein n=1 Tax=Vespula vulgaris TaxID=7454 RepID=A0A834J957_VESVU|nr:hypothetical protein HZH66_012488 [Vespula vulgaris]
MLSRHRRVPIPGFPQRGPIIQLGERNEWPAFTYEDAEYLITSEAERGLVEWVKTVGEVGGCHSTIPCIWFRPLNEQCFRRGGREERHTHYRDSLDTVHKHKGLWLGYALPWKVLPTRTPHGFQVARANGE